MTTASQTIEADDGTEVRIVPYRPDHRDSLERMYADYPAEPRSLGLPPILNDQLFDWLSEVLETGTNFVATAGDEVVGHAVYAPADADEADFVVFVDPVHHGKGIGTALLQVALEDAAESGIDRIVSHAEADNERALHVYDKVGFERLEDAGLVVKVSIDLGGGYDGPEV